MKLITQKALVFISLVAAFVASKDETSISRLRRKLQGNLSLSTTAPKAGDDYENAGLIADKFALKLYWEEGKRKNGHSTLRVIFSSFPEPSFQRIQLAGRTIRAKMVHEHSLP